MIWNDNMAVPSDNDDDDSPTIEQEDDEWVVVVEIEIHNFAVLKVSLLKYTSNGQ